MTMATGMKRSGANWIAAWLAIFLASCSATTEFRPSENHAEVSTLPTQRTLEAYTGSVTTGTTPFGKHTILRPPKGVATRNIGVVIGGGGGATAETVLRGRANTNLSYETEIVLALAEHFTVLVGDLGGFTLGNNRGHDAMTRAHADLVAVGCQPRVACGGVSHGHVIAAHWAASNPDKVRCVFGLIPGTNLQNLRTLPGIFSADPAISQAWGVAPYARVNGALVPGDPLPGADLDAADRNHAELADKAAVLGRNGTPWRAWAGVADGIAAIADARAFAMNYGDSAALIEFPPPANHDDTTLRLVDPDEVCRFIAECSNDAAEKGD